MFSTSKKMIVAGILTVSLLGAGASAALAEEEAAPSADASIGFYSKYVWRGYELSKDSVVIQPSLTTSYKGFSANLWANLDTDLYTSEGNKWNETDFTLSYDGSYDKLGYGVGWIYYALDSSIDTQEFYGTVSYDVLLSPSLTVYYDTDHFGGAWYVDMSIGHSIAFNENMSLDLGLSLSYLDDNDGYNALHNGLVSASMTFPVNEYISITPELYYSFPLSSDAEDYIAAANTLAGFSNDDNYVYGGISASFSF